MKNLKHIVLALIAVLAVAMPAEAQFRFGLKGGLNVNKISVNKSDWAGNFSSDNRTGWQAGLMTEFTVPIIGIGFDASLMYVQRSKELSISGDAQSYLELPINLKYKLGIPAIGRIVTPFLTTGPSFAVKCSKEAVVDGFEERKFDAAWNAGLGVELLHRVQIGAQYSWGINKLYKYIDSKGDPQDFGKINGWVITAALLF